MAGSPQAGHAVSLTWQHLLLALLEALCYSHVSGSWTSSLPGTIRALKGSCVVIPCSFTYPGSRESLGGPFNVVWYQYRSRGYPEIYNSKGTASVLAEYQARTQLLGDLEMKNCTLRISPVRSEDAMSYYVWINPDSVRHRFYDVTVQVEVAGNWRPPHLAQGIPRDTAKGRLAAEGSTPEAVALQDASTSGVRGLAVSGELRGPAWALANVSCAATNAHGQSQAVLPFVPAGDDNLLLMVSSGVIGGVLLLSVLAIVVYKVARARKDEEEGPSIYDNEGNGEQRPSLNGGKPSKAKKDEEFNLYSKELGIDDYEAMERVEDYENLAAEGAGHYGNVGTWQPHLLSEQIYSNV
nr:sialic acid-binding Ig-like lectin 15 [Chrysemys picta bellii]